MQAATMGTRRRSIERRTKAIGWLSVGLGLAELLAPGGFARTIGARKSMRNRALTLSVGVRELVCGIGILARLRPSFWLWGRVAGDIMDLGLLGGAMRSRKANRPKLAIGMASVAGILLLDAVTAMQIGRTAGGRRRALRAPIHVTKSITVNGTPKEVYASWRDLENLPRFMAHLDSVVLGDGRSRWRAAERAGMLVEWDVEVVEDRAGEIMAWRSLDGASVESSGTVTFLPARGGRSTVVNVDLRYAAGKRRIGKALARLFGQDPDTQLENDLRHFKQLVETGEVVHSDASIHRGMHAARPPRYEELEAMR